MIIITILIIIAKCITGMESLLQTFNSATSSKISLIINMIIIQQLIYCEM